MYHIIFESLRVQIFKLQNYKHLTLNNPTIIINFIAKCEGQQTATHYHQGCRAAAFTTYTYVVTDHIGEHRHNPPKLKRSAGGNYWSSGGMMVLRKKLKY